MTIPTESKVVLITGASSGIGEATARVLAAAGHRVVLGARRTDRLEAIAAEITALGGVAAATELDVTDPESMRRFARFAVERFGQVDVLVNNAGVMLLSPLNATLIEEWNRMIDVNLRGTLNGIATVLPMMEERGAGHIVTIASTSGLRVDPTAAVYSATKFAVRALSEGLRQESREVRVTIVSPGLTASDLTLHGAHQESRTAAHAAAEQLAIPASAIGEAIAYAIAQPAQVDVGEIIVRPTAQG